MTAAHPRGRCYCGAFLPGGTRADGITCNACYETFTPAHLRFNGFEWTGDDWAHQPAPTTEGGDARGD